MTETLEEFIHAYQAYEALVVKEQIEFLRQRKYRPIASMFHYYWSDPCPIMGSGLFDYYRRPYKVYEAMKAVYGRVLISVERDVTPYVIGREKSYERGSTFGARIWVTNDHQEAIGEGLVTWELVSVDTAEVVAKNGLAVRIPADAAEEVDRVDWPIPEEARPGTYRVQMRVGRPDGRTLSTNATDIVVR